MWAIRSSITHSLLSHSPHPLTEEHRAILGHARYLQLSLQHCRSLRNYFREKKQLKQRGCCCRCPSILLPSYHMYSFLFFSFFHWIISFPFTLKRNSSARRGCFLVSHETKHGRLNHPKRHNDRHEDNPDLGQLRKFFFFFFPSPYCAKHPPFEVYLLSCFSADWESPAGLCISCAFQAVPAQTLQPSDRSKLLCSCFLTFTEEPQLSPAGVQEFAAPPRLPVTLRHSAS